MRVVDEQPMETLHLYVVPEDQGPPKQDAFAIGMILWCSFLLIGMLAFSLVAPSPDRAVSFSLVIQGYALTPVTKTIKVPILATATIAVGTITFYNGAIYTQIIPVGTVLTGTDGIAVIIDEQAVIPPAAQTTPPTYGQVSVSAHALLSGEAGNIQAGDINLACCVTSVIAQNPSSFTGGRNARTLTYVTQQDITNAVSPMIPTLQAQTMALFLTPMVLDPTCSTATHAINTLVAVIETCQAVSYSNGTLRDAVNTYKKHLGRGTFSHVSFQMVGIAKGDVIRLYVTATFHPIIIRRFPGSWK